MTWEWVLLYPFDREGNWDSGSQHNVSTLLRLWVLQSDLKPRSGWLQCPHSFPQQHTASHGFPEIESETCMTHNPPRHKAISKMSGLKKTLRARGQAILPEVGISSTTSSLKDIQGQRSDHPQGWLVRPRGTEGLWFNPSLYGSWH